MYHIAEIVRDAKRDMQERAEDHEETSVMWWLGYTPLPFLYALSGQITKTMVRKAPDLVKRAAVSTRDQIVDVLTTTHNGVVEFRLTCTRTGQRVFYRVKTQVEHTPLPAPVAPIRSHVAVPMLNAVEGFARFVTSEELPELYFVAKNSMRRNVFLRHLVLPSLGAMEGIVTYVVVLPSQLVFPSREEVESRTDLFLDVSTSRVQSIVEYLYSATEVLDQHWSMVQWNILGRGPYESLSMERREEVIKSIHQRMLIIESKFKMYEFMATIKLQNEMLYADLLKEYPHFGGVPLTQEQIAANTTLVIELEEQGQHSFPCWFYRKLEPGSNAASSSIPSGMNSTGNSANNNGVLSGGKWIEFPSHENRRLERCFRWYQKQKALKRFPLPSSVVLVDEGRHEVCMETMEMRPVYWPALEKIVVCRSLWLYAQRNYGLAPYHPAAAATLENAFTYYLAFHNEEKMRILAVEAQQPRGFYSRRSPVTPKCTLSVPVEGHLVEFKGPNDIMQYKRLLAGTTPFTSKRRVYRGDPRIKADSKTLQTWLDAMECDEEGKPVVPDDDKDIDTEVDHLVLIVHGIGDALKTIDIINVVTLRSIIDCATSLRDLHKEAAQSTHFAHLTDDERERVEFLPIEWHSKLHLEGLDKGIRDSTLPAIPKLREFANDTILDVLFFMSPIFHQVILDEVAKEMNRVFTLFQARNKGWTDREQFASGRRKKVSIVAHSLGSIICFDILSHQKKAAERASETSDAMADTSSDEQDESDDDINNNVEQSCEGSNDAVGNAAMENVNGFEAMFVRKLKNRSLSMSEFFNAAQTRLSGSLSPLERLSGGASPTISSPSTRNRRKKSKNHRQRRNHRKKSVGLVPQLAFTVENLFCFGSPVGLFLNVRGQKLSKDFRLPTCARLFNIYHPYDPVAYRIEPILNPDRAHSKAAIIRTFEGKLRFQYQLRNSFRLMWQKLRQWRNDFEYQVEASVRRVGLVESTMLSLGSSPRLTADNDNALVVSTPGRRKSNSADQIAGNSSNWMLHVDLDGHLLDVHGDEDGDGKNANVYGRLCQGQPIDYSLQENEIEITNEYLFALTAHVIYWTNRDASLFLAQKMMLEPPREEEEEHQEDEQEGVKLNGKKGEEETTASSSPTSSPLVVRRRRRRA